MITNYKLYFRYILLKANFSFINNLSQSEKNYNLLISPQWLYYLSIHLRFSSAFPLTQLVDIMSYELPRSTSSLPTKPSSLTKESSSVIVYNYHSLVTQDRFFIFTQPDSCSLVSSDSVSSITEVFSSANWLEREVSELNGVSFSGKKDLRNLMLQYGDASYPFQKSFPTIGVKEMFYDPLKDTIVQNPVSIQL